MFMFPIRQNATVCDPEKLPRFTLETHPSEPAAQSTLLSWAVWQRCMNLPSSSQPSCGCISLRKVLLCWCTWQCNIGVDDAVAWTVARAALLTWGHTYAPRGPATEVKSHIHSVLNVTANAHFECDPIVGMDVPQAMEMSCRDHGKDCGFLRNVSL